MCPLPLYCPEVFKKKVQFWAKHMETFFMFWHSFP